MTLNYKKAFGIGALSQLIGAIFASLIYNFSSFQFDSSSAGYTLIIFVIPGLVIASGFSLYYYLRHQNKETIGILAFLVSVATAVGIVGLLLFLVFAGFAFNGMNFSNM